MGAKILLEDIAVPCGVAEGSDADEFGVIGVDGVVMSDVRKGCDVTRPPVCSVEMMVY